MSFSLNEPTSTHPTTEVVEDTTTTESTDVDNTSTDGGTDTTDVPADSSTTTGEDTGGEDTGVIEPEAPAETKEPEAAPEVSYHFGEDAVEVEVDQSHREAFEAKGLDIDALAAELYRDGGDFTLSEESLQKCYDAFGKFAIDAFLSGLKAQNEATVSGWKQEAEAKVRADADRFTSICADIGGEEGWGRLEEFALATLSDDELTGFNEVMKSGNQYLQQYALRELEGRRTKVNGDDSVTLIEGKAAPATTGDTGPLGARDYIKATSELGNKFPHDKAGYAKAQAQLDARRRAGLAAGI